MAIEFKKQRSPVRRSFTLIELMLSISIIVILSAISLYAVRELYSTSNRMALEMNTRSMTRLAQRRAKMNHHSYGIILFISGEPKSQHIAFIEPKTAPVDDESWIDVCDRYEIVLPSVRSFRPNHLVSPVEVLAWTDEEFENNDYRKVGAAYGSAGYEPGHFHRNFFVVLFDKNGFVKEGPFVNQGRAFNCINIIISDPDENDDGLGDASGLRVDRVRGEFDGKVDDILSDVNNDGLRWCTSRGFIYYHEGDLLAVDVKFRRKHLIDNARALLLTPRGNIVQARRE